ncbi:MAG: hypothetical protein OXG37_04255 [Actinomycetia bacterium]|nr:hypothetical protein [Actinomycetes bacterium]
MVQVTIRYELAAIELQVESRSRTVAQWCTSATGAWPGCSRGLVSYDVGSMRRSTIRLPGVEQGLGECLRAEVLARLEQGFADPLRAHVSSQLVEHGVVTDVRVTVEAS